MKIEYMEKNIEIYNGQQFIDDRGILRFVNDFDFKNVRRFYQVQNHNKGFIRAWHGHKIEEKYVYVAKGTIWLGIIDMENNSIEKYILSDKDPKILHIPSGKYNGFQTLEDDTIVIFFSTSSINETKNDDIRLPYESFPIFKSEYR